MKKKILCLALMTIMTIGMPMTAKAEHFQGAKDWSVYFDGDEMHSNFKTAEMTEEILNIQPGDSIDLQVKVENKSDIVTDWYMTNEVLKTLEDTQNTAEGGAYTYILTYLDVNKKETVLYSSDVVGGEEDLSKEGEGLHQATNYLEDYFFLDQIEPGEQGTVKLHVKLDGETQGNGYQNTLARLQMNFAVEKVAIETITEYITKTNTKVITNVVKTGDDAMTGVFSALALGSGLVLVVASVRTMKRDQRED